MTLGKKTNKQKQNPLFFCFLCLARRTLNPDGSWHSRKCLGKGCVLSAPPHGHQNLCSNKSSQGFSAGVVFFWLFLFFFFRREKFFQGFIPSLCPGTILWSPWEKRWGWILDASLPRLPFRERWDELLSLLAEFECWSPNISCARDLFQSLGPPCWMSRMGGIFPAVLGGFSLQFWGEVAA